MDGEPASDSHGIIREGASREIILPAEMARRGLELAIQIEKRQGIEPVKDSEKCKTPLLRFFGALKHSCVSFSKNGQVAAIASDSRPGQCPGLVIWNMTSREASLFADAANVSITRTYLSVVDLLSEQNTDTTQPSPPVSGVAINRSLNPASPLGEADSGTRDIECVALSGSGDMALLGYADGGLYRCRFAVRSATEFKPLARDRGGHEVTAIAISPDDQFFAEYCFHVVRVHETASGKERQQFPGYSLFYNTLAFSEDGSRLLIARGLEKGSFGSCLTLVDLSGRRAPLVFCADRVQGTATAAISSDNQLVVSMDDGIITLWDAINAREIRHWKHTEAPTRGTGEETRISQTISIRMNNPGVWGYSSLAISPDCTRILSSGADQYMRLWSLAGDPIWEYPHDSKVIKVAFHPDGRRALAGCWDGSVYVWELP